MNNVNIRGETGLTLTETGTAQAYTPFQAGNGLVVYAEPGSTSLVEQGRASISRKMPGDLTAGTVVVQARVLEPYADLDGNSDFVLLGDVNFRLKAKSTPAQRTIHLDKLISFLNSTEVRNAVVNFALPT